MREMRFWKWCDRKWCFPEGVPPGRHAGPTPGPARPPEAAERRKEPVRVRGSVPAVKRLASQWPRKAAKPGG